MSVSCRWCSDGGCLLCQMSDSITMMKETGGISSPAGRLDRVRHITPGLDFVSEARGCSNARRCAICGLPYQEMAMHYRQAHPGVQYNLKGEKAR